MNAGVVALRHPTRLSRFSGNPAAKHDRLLYVWLHRTRASGRLVHLELSSARDIDDYPVSACICNGVIIGIDIPLFPQSPRRRTPGRRCAKTSVANCRSPPNGYMERVVLADVCPLVAFRCHTF